MAEVEVGQAATTRDIDHRVFAFFDQALDQALGFAQDGRGVRPRHAAIRSHRQNRNPVSVGALLDQRVIQLGVRTDRRHRSRDGRVIGGDGFRGGARFTHARCRDHLHGAENLLQSLS